MRFSYKTEVTIIIYTTLEPYTFFFYLEVARMIQRGVSDNIFPSNLSNMMTEEYIPTR